MRVAAAWAVLTVGTLAGCGSAAKPPATSQGQGKSAAPIAGTSDFAAGATIPRIHTCDGSDRSPPLRATDLPAATKEVVVVMRDPDAPGGNFIHWAVAHLTPANGSLALAAGAATAGAVLG